MPLPRATSESPIRTGSASTATPWKRCAGSGLPRSAGTRPAGFALTELEAIMTFEELEEAERLANEWRAAFRRAQSTAR